MALDFTGYVDAYTKGRGQTQPEPSNYTKLFGTPEYNFKENTKRSINSGMDPLLQAALLDVKDWDPTSVDFSKMKSAGSAYMEWKADLSRPANHRAANFAKENNLDNFAAFKQMYDQQIGAYAPMVQNKLQQHQAMNHVSDNQMRNMLGQYSGLQGVLAQSPQQLDAQGMPLAAPNWVVPRRTWGQWASGQGRDVRPIPAAIGAVRAAQIGTGMVQKGVGTTLETYNPFGKGRKSMVQLSKTGAKDVAKVAFDKAPKTGPKSKAMSSAQGKAQSAYNKAEKLYKKNEMAKRGRTKGLGYGKRGRTKGLGYEDKKKLLNKKIKDFSKTTKGAKLKTAIEKATKANIAYKKNLAQSPIRQVGAFVKKHGMGGLINKVVKKAGWQGAAKLLGKGALSLGLKGTGIGAAGSLALDAWTLYELANMLTSD